MSDYTLFIETKEDPDLLREQLRKWAPWRYAVQFSGGVSTAEFEHVDFFVGEPLAKFRLFQQYLPDGLAGGQALDIGCNIGHNAFHLRQRYGLEVTGIDDSSRNIEIARYLTAVGGFDGVRFHRADANQFVTEQRFDLILHLTTLIFLRDPFLALRNTVKMLQPGGCLVLEAEAYRDPEGDEALCKFHPHATRADPREPWWSLGKGAVEGMLSSAGCNRVEVVHEWRFRDRLYRTFFVGIRA